MVGGRCHIVDMPIRTIVSNACKSHSLVKCGCSMIQIYCPGYGNLEDLLGAKSSRDRRIRLADDTTSESLI